MQIVPQLLFHYIFGTIMEVWEDPYPCHVLLKVTKTPALPGIPARCPVVTRQNPVGFIKYLRRDMQIGLLDLALLEVEALDRVELLDCLLILPHPDLIRLDNVSRYDNTCVPFKII